MCVCPCVHVCMHECVHVYMHGYVHAYVACVCAHLFLHMSVCTCMWKSEVEVRKKILGHSLSLFHWGRVSLSKLGLADDKFHQLACSGDPSSFF